MKLKKNIKKVFFITALLVVGCVMLTILIAAINRQQDHICKKLVVTIKGSGEKNYIDKADVVRQLQAATNSRFVNKPIKDFDLSQLERVVKTNLWVSDANIYFDGQDELHVLITAKEPIARVFTTKGASFYLDSSGKQMPLLEKITLRLPVFTNYPATVTSKSKDSSLMAGVKTLAKFINNDSFWNSQIAQVNILEGRTFEAVPTIGNHLIKIGTADSIESKFKKLFTFYQMVLTKTGFNKYSVLDVQFANQIVATHKGAGVTIDSLQLQRNIQELLKKSKLQMQQDALQQENSQTDTTEKKDTVSVSIKKSNVKSFITIAVPNKKVIKHKPAKVSNPYSNMKKTKSLSVKNKPKTKKADSRKPKAVLHKKSL